MLIDGHQWHGNDGRQHVRRRRHPGGISAALRGVAQRLTVLGYEHARGPAAGESLSARLRGVKCDDGPGFGGG